MCALMSCNTFIRRRKGGGRWEAETNSEPLRYMDGGKVIFSNGSLREFDFCLLALLYLLYV